MKRRTIDRFRDAARAGHNALSSAQVLSGNPVLTRGERALVGTDPLRLALVQAGRQDRTPTASGASSSSHGAPERELFHVPAIVPQAACSKEGEVDEC
ncbi:hypothetical protein [Burkholderia ubonensis]|uniref:hypothetical protein n=1 Tax=Burkholderia ubonensis TaxID=101571 RepID=UPI0012F70C69|nr:hypothetical protein [Burkholderia ubonensis]